MITFTRSFLWVTHLSCFLNNQLYLGPEIFKIAISLTLPLIFHFLVFVDLLTVGDVAGVISAVTGKIEVGEGERKGRRDSLCPACHVSGTVPAFWPPRGPPAFSEPPFPQLNCGDRKDCNMACWSLREHLVQLTVDWIVQLGTEAQRVSARSHSNGIGPKNLFT